MRYDYPLCILGNLGNNTFGEGRGLLVPDCIVWDITKVCFGRDIAFADTDEKGVVRASFGLAHFVRTDRAGTPAIIVDNHNHVLYFWHEAMVSGSIPSGIPVVHIDMHSDLWANECFPWELLSNDSDAVFRYVNFSCSVGNYLIPALVSGRISRVIRIEGEYDMRHYRWPDGPYIANIDLDFFAPELDYIDYDMRVQFVRAVCRDAVYITVATSPGFIDSERVLSVLWDIWSIDTESSIRPYVRSCYVT